MEGLPMAKVQFKYCVGKKYERKYKQKIIDMKLPTDRYGFIIPIEITEKLYTYLKENGINNSRILWHQVIESIH
jgi:hypothetical protein